MTARNEAQRDLLAELDQQADGNYPEAIDKMGTDDLLRAILLELREQSPDPSKWSAAKRERRTFDR
jgi:hypothetical protein